jgi:hypothetical protein
VPALLLGAIYYSITHVTQSGKGHCSALASFHGARIQTSRSSAVVKITGIALRWIASTIPFGDEGSCARKPRRAAWPLSAEQ